MGVFEPLTSWSMTHVNYGWHILTLVKYLNSYAIIIKKEEYVFLDEKEEYVFFFLE